MNETLTHWLIEVKWRNVWNSELCHHKLRSGLLPNQLQASNRICYAPFSNKSRGLSCSKIITLIFVFKNAFEGNESLISAILTRPQWFKGNICLSGITGIKTQINLLLETDIKHVQCILGDILTYWGIQSNGTMSSLSCFGFNVSI